MKLYGINLPELIPENATKILTTCRDIHQDEIDRDIRNTARHKWDQYWVNAYNVIIKRIED